MFMQRLVAAARVLYHCFYLNVKFIGHDIVQQDRTGWQFSYVFVFYCLC